MADSPARCGMGTHSRAADGARSLSVPPVAIRPAEQLGQALHLVVGLAVGAEPGGGPAHGVHDGRVVAPTEAPADLGERELGRLAREVHGDLAGPDQARGAAGGEQLAAGDAEGLADRVLDRLDGWGRRGAAAGRAADLAPR